MPETITIKRAEAHEALFLKFEALNRLAAGVATRNPVAPVPEEVRSHAEDLLYDCRAFVRDSIRLRSIRRGGVEPAAPTYGGLGAQLGAALAALEAFELRHTQWDPGLKCVVGRVAGTPLPVRRLNPKPAVLPPRDRQSSGIQRRLIERIMRSREAAYDNGYRAGHLAGAGKPFPEYDEVPYPTYSVWSAGVERVETGTKM